jgi:two-component system nitrogen regulation sensor histidine kinase NtrY
MPPSAHQRRVLSIILGVVALALTLAYVALNAFKLNFLTPDTSAEFVLFTAISAVAFLCFVGIVLMLVRNLLKLYSDQKSGVMGSRLRTRMLWGAVMVSLVPITFMFLFSYGLMNRAVDRWFSQPVTEMREDANRVALDLAQYTTANARTEAESIAAALPPLDSARDRTHDGSGVLTNRVAVERVLRQHQITLQGGFVVLFRDGKPVAALNLPQRAPGGATVKPWLPTQPRVPADAESAESTAAGPAAEPLQPEALTPGPVWDVVDPANAGLLVAARRGDNPIFTLAGADYALGEATLPKQAGSVENVVAGLPLPRGLSATMSNLQSQADRYWVLYRERRTIRNTYMVYMIMITVLALFAACWLALHLSKQVTKPVEALADAMAAIAAGNYAHRVEDNATEELGDLVRSFNHMAADLDQSRAQVEASTQLLSAANAALQARRGELETMLETIPNGVATLSPDGRILLANRALSEMLDPGGQRSFVGSKLAEVFPAELLEAVDRLMRRSHRMGSAAGEMELTRSGPYENQTMNLAATVALLEAPGTHQHLGYVIALENATELLRAQKQSAWKEVARRVAHEIKNPLTPISLSAEQIARHIDRLDTTLAEASLESPSVAVIRRCSTVISSSVESMRGLVDQFAALAQFPTAMPRPADLNTIVGNSLALFAGRTQEIHIITRFAPDLPLVLADPEAMKRSLGNLVDNAIEAMQGALLRELRITTALLPSGLIELTVADTGTGLTDEMRERLFLPYFSTKQRGTGLGLAIAAKIIQEHGGTIRAEKNEPTGAKFIVELQPASASESGQFAMASKESLVLTENT